VLAVSFALLLLAFRSLVVAVVAILLNLVSIGAALGLVALVFQNGYGAALLGARPAAAVDAWVPILLFCALFGLSMDYHVFLLSRIKEHWDLTGDTTDAVHAGLRDTRGVIAGAAAIMVVVFGCFAFGRVLVLQQVGFGLAVAVLLDATVVRSLLLPATMTLLGERNWYLPPGLRWLPRIATVERGPTPAATTSELGEVVPVAAD
jgi:RND superfamily putative drug exporter